MLYADKSGTELIYDEGVTYTKDAPSVTGEKTIKLPAAAAGKTAIYLYREDGDTQWNPTFDYISVTRPCSVEPEPDPDPDPENPDPETPDPENPDPENPDPENPDPENPDPENPDPENPEPGDEALNDIVNPMPISKVIENGELVIIKNGVKYNAQGVILQQSK